MNYAVAELLDRRRVNGRSLNVDFVTKLVITIS